MKREKLNYVFPNNEIYMANRKLLTMANVMIIFLGICLNITKKCSIFVNNLAITQLT